MTIMANLHQGLTKEAWEKLPFLSQMANVGAEVGRSISWREKDGEKSKAAFERGLELLDFSIEDKKNRKHLKEMCRLREVLVDYFYCANEYGSTDQQWNRYFDAFGYAAALARGL